MKIVYFAFLSLFLTSCSQRWCNTRYPAGSDTVRVETVRDSIILKDTTVFIKIPGETVTNTVEIPCPPPPPSYIPKKVTAETSLARASAWWEYPVIKLELIQKDTTITQRLDNAIREAYHWKTLYEKLHIKADPVKFVPGIYKASFWAWIGVIVAALGYIALKIFVFKK